MARSARRKSETGVYHVLLRSMADGFFQSVEDFEKFSELLKQNKKECGYFLYAYVLLKEEIRLLIKPQTAELETIFKKLCVKYSYWYNCKYGRRGSVFFDRFKSEPVGYEYFDDVLRYIIRYPEKYGERYDLYPYSSLKVSEEIDFYKKIDDDFFIVKPQNEYLVINVSSPRLTDETAIKRILDITGVLSLDKAIGIDYSKNREYIKQMLNAGIGYRQITRILGLNYVLLKRIISGEDTPQKRSKAQVENTVKINKTENVEPIDFFLL